MDAEIKAAGLDRNADAAEGSGGWEGWGGEGVSERETEQSCQQKGQSS